MATYWDKYKVNVPEGRSGAWRVERFVLAGTKDMYTRLIKNGDGSWNETVMSDTPIECNDLRYLFDFATGRVLLNGLGLGVDLRGVLAIPSVTNVDVVEISEDVIKLVWPTYSSDQRAHLHRGDALTVSWPIGVRWDVVWHDIWHDLRSDHVEQMELLRRKYHDRCNWQDSWCRHEMSQMSRRSW